MANIQTITLKEYQELKNNRKKAMTKKKGRGPAIAAFVLAILATLFWLTSFTLISFVLSIIALAMCGQSKKVKGQPYKVFRGIAIPLSIIALVISILNIVFIFVASVIIGLVLLPLLPIFILLLPVIILFLPIILTLLPFITPLLNLLLQALALALSIAVPLGVVVLFSYAFGIPIESLLPFVMGMGFLAIL